MQQGLGNKCPLNKMKPCIKEECAWYVKSTKTNPQTKESYQFNVCAIVMVPDMLIDVIKNTNGTQAAVEHSRNESVKRQDALLGVFDTMRRKSLADSER